ncbi:MAG: hypothetical protein LBE86_11780 [Gemmobacter sp.]|nr:hypothetical protein [Gemmobacter sp.]
MTIDDDEPEPVEVNLLRGSALDDWLRGWQGLDWLIGRGGNDTLHGRGGGDVLLGGAGTDILQGGSGTDSLNGGAGRDRLEGGTGHDMLTGGTGADVFVLRFAGRAHADTITDFGRGTDRLLLTGPLFNGLGAADFALAGEKTPETRLIWNAASGQLFFDPDGSGGAAQRLITTLTPGSELDPGDLLFG